MLPLPLLPPRGGFLMLFPCFSLGFHPHKTVLHGLLQWESLPEATLHTQLQQESLPWGAVLQGVHLGDGWQWFPLIWGKKLLEACHRSHPCTAPTTKTLPHKPNMCGVASLLRLKIYVLEMVNCARDKLYFYLATIKVSSFVTKPQNFPSRKEILAVII